MRFRPILIAGCCYIGAALLFLTWGARGDWEFILAFRGQKLLALSVVAFAVAISTVVFQTLTGNRILTPAIMGFDALYLLIQTTLVFTLGGARAATLDSTSVFAVETTLLIGAASLLFGTMLRRSEDLNRMVLTGIVLGILLHSLNALVIRLIDPSEYAYVMANSYARFNNVDTDLVGIAAGVTATVTIILTLMCRRLDLLALGRDTAMILGVDHGRQLQFIMVLVTILVAVSTALVGPIVFFGLLVSAIVYQVAGTWRHATLLPLSALTAAALLVLCQALFERVLNMQSTVSVVIESLGGIVFLLALFRRART